MADHGDLGAKPVPELRTTVLDVALDADPVLARTLVPGFGAVKPSVMYAPSVKFRGGTVSSVAPESQAIDANGGIAEAVVRETNIVQLWG